MCQGVIVSLVSFKVKGKTRRVVLSGVGSHSELIQSSAKRLKRAGWKENPSDRVVSIESDFSGWNKYSLAGGNPTTAETAILSREYKRIAGNAKALIAHVKSVKKIDDALLRLLTAPALAEYEKVTAPALAEYEKVTAPAWAEYEKVTAPALAEYEKVTAAALAEYEKVRAAAWCKLFAKAENRVGCLR
jgi:hypothetical protein